MVGPSLLASAVQDEKQLSELRRSFPSSVKTAYPISTLVKNPKTDMAACIEPLKRA